MVRVGRVGSARVGALPREPSFLSKGNWKPGGGRWSPRVSLPPAPPWGAGPCVSSSPVPAPGAGGCGCPQASPPPAEPPVGAGPPWVMSARRWWQDRMGWGRGWGGSIPLSPGKGGREQRAAARGSQAQESPILMSWVCSQHLHRPGHLSPRVPSCEPSPAGPARQRLGQDGVSWWALIPVPEVGLEGDSDDRDTVVPGNQQPQGALTAWWPFCRGRGAQGSGEGSVSLLRGCCVGTGTGTAGTKAAEKIAFSHL